MDSARFTGRILDDEGLRGDLDDAEATLLISKLVGLIEAIAAKASREDDIWPKITALSKKGRAIAKAVCVFRDREPDQAKMLAQTAGLTSPTVMPKTATELLTHYLKQLAVE